MQHADFALDELLEGEYLAVVHGEPVGVEVADALQQNLAIVRLTKGILGFPERTQAWRERMHLGGDAQLQCITQLLDGHARIMGSLAKVHPSRPVHCLTQVSRPMSNVRA